MYSELAEILSDFNLNATQNYYDDQLTAKENCPCAGCVYFEDEFLKKKLNLFTFLAKMGIDVRKEQDLDPDGLWMMLDDNQEFSHCLISYVLFGDFDQLIGEKHHFEFLELAVKIELDLHFFDKDCALLFFVFDPS